MSPRNRIWLLVVVVVGLGVVALGYLLGISPKLEEIKAADAARAEAASTNSVYETQLAKLKKDYEGLDDIQDQLDELNVQLPAEAGYETYLTVVHDIAIASGTGATDFTWGAPELFTANSAAFIAAAATAEGDEPAPTEPELTGVAPNGSLVGLSWGVTVRGKLDGLRAFIGYLQRTERLFLVTGFSITQTTGESAAPDDYTMVLNGLTFVLVNNEPADQAPTDENTEAPADEPSATPTPTDTPTASATPTP